MSLQANNEIALHVAEPDVAERFYVDVLGCTVTDRKPDCISLTSGSLRLYLLRDPQPVHDRAIPSFDTPNRSAALERTPNIAMPSANTTGGITRSPRRRADGRS